ncbi:major facilitator superfamily domain-containing protein [Rhodocollybia butyracea]|uniref:Major facilitator superfamily domain-containing protein n=1 Tax=Rhodocollybia butyracea TaxID=206335 RepID=A0A9P5U606_9AGAR|nr:major facilitator superfamily domain-containing protein [Rhodocollybia butyracea]
MASEKGSSVSGEPLATVPHNAGMTSHVLDERRRVALAEVDNAKFSWFHVKVCFTAGVGFFTDAYDIFAINIASTMMGYVYGATHTALTSNASLGIKVATPVGTLIGQLLFGWLADVVGRKKMYGFELMIIIFTTFAQALSANGPSVNIIGVLVVWRVLMGIGIGGDYPLSAVISSEFASTRSRGRLMTAVFAFQGWGQLAASIVSCITVAGYKQQILHDVAPNFVAIDKCWRILIGMGCVPGVIALYFRLTIPETPRFTMDIERNIQQASKDIEAVLALKEENDIPLGTKTIKHFGQWKYMKVLIGTSWSWFVLDIAFYGLGLNSSIILQAMGFGSGSSKGNQGIYNTLINVSIGNLILSIAGLIPGYWASFSLSTRGKAFVFLYCLADFFQNFGPNVTTFVIPGEVFPTRYRSTAHGISAASGKLGAVIAQVGFAKLSNIGGTNAFLGHILEIFALFMLTGIFSTLLIPETKGQSLEEINEEE